MRRRHGGAAEVGEGLVRHRVRRLRREPGKNIDARRGHVGFHDIADGSGSARRERRHHVAGLWLGQQQALLEHGRDFVTGFHFGDDQVAVRLADHDRGYVDESSVAVHYDGIARDAVDHRCNGARVACMLNLEVEVAAAAFNEGDVAGDVGIVDQWLAGVRRGSGAAGIVVVIHENQRRLDRVAVTQRRGEIGFLDGVFAGDRRWLVDLHRVHRRFAVARGSGDGYRPWSAGRGTDRAEIRPFVARRDDREHAGLGGVHQRDVVRCRDLQHRAADRVVDDVNAIGNGAVDGVCEVGCVAAGSRVARPQPASLVHGDARPRRDALDAADQRTEDGRLHAVAGGCRYGVRTMPVDVSRRANLARIDWPGILGAGDEIAGTDQLVIAVGLVEILARLADTDPVFRRLENELVVLLIEAAAQPAPEK